MKTRMMMSVLGAKFDNYITHTYFKSLSSLTWTLDYSRRSTLGESIAAHMCRLQCRYWSLYQHC